MRTFVLLALLLVFITSPSLTSAQNRPFGKYNFDEGGYTLIGVFDNYRDAPIQKQVGQFYIDDVKLLKAIQNSWNFTRPQKMYACGYHYHVILLKNGKKIESLNINLECSQIVTSEGSRVFAPSILKRLVGKISPIKEIRKEFSDINEARTYWKSIKEDARFLFAYEPAWLKFEGRFRFQSKCPANNLQCYRYGEDREILAEVNEKVRKAFPGENFELKTSGGSSNGEVFFEITCDKELEKKFDIFDRWNREMFGKFEAFPLYLTSYWK